MIFFSFSLFVFHAHQPTSFALLAASKKHRAAESDDEDEAEGNGEAHGDNSDDSDAEPKSWLPKGDKEGPGKHILKQ